MWCEAVWEHLLCGVGLVYERPAVLQGACGRGWGWCPGISGGTDPVCSPVAAPSQSELAAGSIMQVFAEHFTLPGLTPYGLRFNT